MDDQDDDVIVRVHATLVGPCSAMPPDTPQWLVVLDPARPSWPGVLIACQVAPVLISVEAGEPLNFADSKAWADQIVALLQTLG